MLSAIPKIRRDQCRSESLAWCAPASAAIYHGLQTWQLRWADMADWRAGIADQVVLGFDQEVIVHHFKSSRDLNP